MPRDFMGPTPLRPVPWPPYRWDTDDTGGPETDDETLVLPKAQDWERDRNMERFELVKDALDLIVDLWPQPGYASVTLETHQWVKLRRVLLAIPDLVAHDE